MNTVLIPPGPGGYGKGLWLPTGSGKKVLSLTGREIHPVANRRTYRIGSGEWLCRYPAG